MGTIAFGRPLVEAGDLVLTGEDQSGCQGVGRIFPIIPAHLCFDPASLLQ